MSINIKFGISAAIAVTAICLAAWMARFELSAPNQGMYVHRLDRWTGEVCAAYLAPAEGSKPYENYCWNR